MAQRCRIAHAAFTLIELLVVISIIAILSALLLSSLAVVKDAAAAQACGSNLRQVGVALGAYQADYAGQYPLLGIGTIVQNWWSPGPGGRWQHYLEEYTETFAVFNCPTVKRRRPEFAVRDATDASGIRGDAPSGRVCAYAADSRVWIRYPEFGPEAWKPSAPYGPINDAKVRAQLASLNSSNALYKSPNPPARADLCPVISDGVWQNDGDNQVNNNYSGAYFPHRKKGNFLFNDGHLERHAAGDFRTLKPIVQLRAP